MADPLKRSVRRLMEKRKAAVIAEVIRDTGRINLTEAYRRYHPTAKESTAHGNCDDMLKGGVMDELEKLLKIRDPELMKKLKPEAIVQDLVEDLNVLNRMRDDGKLTVEDMVKILNAKAGKQKLLGMAIGMWRAEQPAEKQKTADELLAALNHPGEKTE